MTKQERRKRYEASPPLGLSVRRLNFYGHFKHGRLQKRLRVCVKGTKGCPTQNPGHTICWTPVVPQEGGETK